MKLKLAKAHGLKRAAAPLHAAGERRGAARDRGCGVRSAGAGAVMAAWRHESSEILGVPAGLVGRIKASQSELSEPGGGGGPSDGEEPRVPTGGRADFEVKEPLARADNAVRRAFFARYWALPRSQALACLAFRCQTLTTHLRST
jgi:hypothetical protein